MKQILRWVCIAVFLLGLLCAMGIVIAGLAFLVADGMWYIPVAMVVLILAIVGMFILGDT